MKIAPNLPELGRINAINRVLDAMGQTGISSLAEIDYHVDAGSINGYLDSYSATLQTNGGKGWWFNREEYHRLNPAPDTGRVVLPNTTLAVRLNRDIQNRNVKLAVRGKHLIDLQQYGFDLRALADEHTGIIPLTIVAYVDFDDLPQTAKDAIVDTCRFWYIHDKDVDQVKFQALQQQAQRSMINLQQEETSGTKRNIFSNRYNMDPLVQIGGFFNNN